MKTIKIFLASSEELKDDRLAFGNLVRQLDDIYKKRGIHIELKVWEEMDPSLQAKRKQDEYNDVIRECDIFVALFHRRAGEYTREEFNVALEERIKKNIPQILIYCRELRPGEQEFPELTEFKQRLDKELGHFWRQYAISDTMHFNFVMWLYRTEAFDNDTLKVEDGKVTIDGVGVVQMDKLPFVADNADFREMKSELETLDAELEKLERIVAENPGISDLNNLLQKKRTERINLKKKLGQYQSSLLDTAKRIAKMEMETVSGILQRAIYAFENGNLSEANALLNEIAHDAEHHFDRLEQDRALIHQDIDAFQLQAKTIIADVSIPIENRIASVREIYAKADEWARCSAYDKKKYAQLLFDYSEFLKKYAFYHEAQMVFTRQISLAEEVYGINHPKTAHSYNEIGLTFSREEKYDEALQWYQKSLQIRLSLFGEEHQDTAESYNNIGYIYRHKDEYDKAIEYYVKSLNIRLNVLGENHPMTAKSYNNIGYIYSKFKDYPKAMEYYNKALTIKESTLGREHLDTARTCVNVGYVYSRMHDIDKAFEYYSRALEIRTKELGINHPFTQRVIKKIEKLKANN